MSSRLVSPKIIALVLMAALCALSSAQKEPPLEEPVPAPTLANARVLPTGAVSFEIRNQTNAVYEIHAGNLASAWSNIANLHGPEPWALPVFDFLRYVDPAADSARKFYRVAARPKTPQDDWKNQMVFANEPFARNTSDSTWDSPRWIKFSIPTNEPSRVYFQDSHTYPFHYDFAKARLPQFAGMTPAQFDEASLHPATQRVLLGAVLMPAVNGPREFAIQLAGAEPYPRETVARVFDIVQAAVFAAEPLARFYFPTYEQNNAALNDREFFAGKGIEVSSLDRWIEGNVAYSRGWGVGRLVFIPGNEIEGAYLDGRLLPTDILLTDGVPAEIPFLTGVVSLSPSTPNSHVALLAQSQNVPFVYLAQGADRAAITNLVGRQIALGSSTDNTREPFKLVDLSLFDGSVRDTLLSLKTPPRLEYSPKLPHQEYVISVDNLTPVDTKHVGGKAANFGTLRRSIPSNSPPALAITFRLWSEFMAQPSGGGMTLEQRIQQTLAPFTNYPPNMGQLNLALAMVREWIEDTTTFSEQQQAAIEQALMIFDPKRKIRFRSSTNVEDTETFIGAGLYDSYSGCLADDQDADTSGPSICDPSEARERGVFRAIRKVFASFYNDNAFLERLRRGVNEAEVGMGVLVHYSVPDETELANGVATATVTGGFFPGMDTKMVTQKGAVSVTNPDGSARPEIVEISRWGTTTKRQDSTLVPIGAYVLEAPSDYEAFTVYFERAATEHKLVTGKTEFTLDFEYKKILQPDGSAWLSVKQVREVPSANQATRPAYVLSEPVDFVVLQGEAGDIFSVHRLKAELRLSANFTQLATNLTSSFFGVSKYAVTNRIESTVIEGLPSAWPQAHFAMEQNGYGTRDSWLAPSRDGQRRLTLSTAFYDAAAPGDQLPIRTLADAMIHLEAEYFTPVVGMDWNGQRALVTNESARLVPPLQRSDRDLLQTRDVQVGSAHINTTFYWPPHPEGLTVGYTAPLVAFVRTTVAGLTEQPFELVNYYAQTYRPGHHNFSEDFMFEPQLDPNVPAAIQEELRAKNIRMLHVHWGGVDGTDRVTLFGFDDSARAVSAR